MKISEIMSREVRTTSPETTLQEAAILMRQADIGALIISEDDRMVGMLTDRDIVIRAIAEGKSLNTPVRQIMSDEIKYCRSDESIDHVAKNMAQIQKRRLPVVDKQKRLVGVVSLANIASVNTDKVSANLLRGVASAH